MSESRGSGRRFPSSSPRAPGGGESRGPGRRDAPSVSCRNAALAFLGRRAYTRRELEIRLLRKGYGAEEVGDTLAGLEERGWVDDAKTAAALAVSEAAKGRGRGRIASSMASRGVPRELAEGVLAGLDPVAESARLMEMLARRAGSHPSGLTPSARSKRLFDYLVRRGFSPGAVREALREKGDLPDDESD